MTPIAQRQKEATRSAEPKVTAREVVERVPLPPAVVPPEREEQLKPRDRQIRRELTEIFTKHGFARYRMIDLAAELHCSLRTLYRLGASREELFLVVIDRIAATWGRSSVNAVTPDMTALEAIKAYLHVGNAMVRLFQ